MAFVQPLGAFSRALPTTPAARRTVSAFHGAPLAVRRVVYRSSSSQHALRMSLAGALWAKYNVALVQQPLLTKSLTSATLMTLSDLIAQKLQKSDSSPRGIDWVRMLKATLLGLLFLGPVGHYWYSGIEQYVHGTSAMAIATKVWLDQVVCAPFTTAVIFFYTELLRARGSLSRVSLRTRAASAAKYARAQLWPTMLASYRIWPLVQTLTFSVVPVSLRVLFVSSVSLLWLTFLSTITNAKPKAPAQQQQEDAQRQQQQQQVLQPVTNTT